MLNIGVLTLKETECSDDPSVTSITVPYYCTEYLYFITIIIIKFVRQIVKGHCRRSQDSLLSAIVLNVMQIESLVPPGVKKCQLWKAVSFVRFDVQREVIVKFT